MNLAYENDNIEHKQILEPSKIKSVPMDGWVLHKMNVETLDYGTEVWVGETIFNSKRKHQNTKCFNCGRMGHLRRDYKQWIPRNNSSSGNNRNRRTQPSVICRRCDKGQHWTNECWSMKDRQGNLIPLGNTMECLSQAPMMNVVKSLPVTVENLCLQEN